MYQIDGLSSPRPPETTPSRYALSVICQSTFASTNHERFTSFRRRKALNNLRHQRAQLRERIARRYQHDHGDIERRFVAGQISLQAAREALVKKDAHG